MRYLISVIYTVYDSSLKLFALISASGCSFGVITKQRGNYLIWAYKGSSSKQNVLKITR